MSAAALTPRVRILVLCDEVLPSEIEEGVFTLEGVRQHLRARTFPWKARLQLFLLLSSPRKGTYPGRILVIDEADENERAIRYLRFSVTFHEDNENVSIHLDIGECDFSEPGPYMFQVWFTSGGGQEVLKGELPLQVVWDEE